MENCCAKSLGDHTVSTAETSKSESGSNQISRYRPRRQRKLAVQSMDANIGSIPRRHRRSTNRRNSLSHSTPGNNPRRRRIRRRASVCTSTASTEKCLGTTAHSISKDSTIKNYLQPRGCGSKARSRRLGSRSTKNNFKGFKGRDLQPNECVSASTSSAENDPPRRSSRRRASVCSSTVYRKNGRDSTTDRAFKTRPRGRKPRSASMDVLNTVEDFKGNGLKPEDSASKPLSRGRRVRRSASMDVSRSFEKEGSGLFGTSRRPSLQGSSISIEQNQFWPRRARRSNLAATAGKEISPSIHNSHYGPKRMQRRNSEDGYVMVPTQRRPKGKPTN